MSFQVCNHLAEEERPDCFVLLVFLLSCDSLCSVSFLVVTWVGLWSVIGAFLGLIHLLFVLLNGYSRRLLAI